MSDGDSSSTSNTGDKPGEGATRLVSQSQLWVRLRLVQTDTTHLITASDKLSARDRAMELR